MIFRAIHRSISNRNSAAFLLVAVCAATLAACGGSDTEDSAGTAPPPTPAAGDKAASLSGTAIFNGPLPERVVLLTESDPICTMAHTDDPLLSDREIVSEDGGIKNVFVYIKEAPEGEYPVPTQQKVLDQVGCRYIPHVLGVQVGQELRIENSDPTMHNVRSFARKNRPFNTSLPMDAAPRIKKFDNVELGIRIKCDIHPWMTAFIFAMDHPFFATTDENGAYTISGLPAGEYTLVAWHEKYGEQESVVTISEGEDVVADFTFEPTA